MKQVGAGRIPQLKPGTYADGMPIHQPGSTDYWGILQNRTNNSRFPTRPTALHWSPLS
jgi:hypothetical protein